MTTINHAINIATQLHKDQVRKVEGLPYIVHPAPVQHGEDHVSPEGSEAPGVDPVDHLLEDVEPARFAQGGGDLPSRHDADRSFRIRPPHEDEDGEAGTAGPMGISGGTHPLHIVRHCRKPPASRGIPQSLPRSQTTTSRSSSSPQ